MADTWKKIHHHSKRCWHFFWHSESGWSWLANIVVAFVLIRFVVYPLLGLILGTSFPIVAVVSESMEHEVHNGVLCGRQLSAFPISFDNYWNLCGKWYSDRGITSEQFHGFPFRNGFYKGDVIILWRANQDNLNVGDVLVFQGHRPQPIIHRIVKSSSDNGEQFYQTKGDHNSDSISGELGEEKISSDRIFGKAVLRIPYLGWMKILFVNAVKPLGIEITR